MCSLKLKISFVLLTLFLGGSFSSLRAIGATYYVAKNGNDANNGSINSPFLTIAKGVSVLAPGDSLLIRSGSYSESLYNTIPTGTSWTSPITISGYPGEIVIIKPTSGTRVIDFETQSYVILDGLIIDGSGVGFDGIQVNNTGAHHIRIKNTEVKNSPSNGINLAGSNCEILNVLIHDVGISDQNHGIYVSSSGNFLDKITVYNASGYGIHQFHTPADSNNNLIRNIRAFDNGRATPSLAAGVLIGSGVGNICYNVISYGNPYGVKVGYGATNGKAYNCTTWGNDLAGVFAKDGSGIRIINCISWNNPTQIQNSSGAFLSNNLTTQDPRFINPNSGDFHLLSNSPAINTGLTLNEVPTDFDGLTRPQGSAYCIGSYEYPKSLPPAPPVVETPIIVQTSPAQTNGGYVTTGGQTTTEPVATQPSSAIGPQLTLAILIGIIFLYVNSD